MTLLNGIDATRQLRKISPATKIIIWTVHNEPQYVAEAMSGRVRLLVEELCSFGAVDCDPAGIKGLRVPDAISPRARGFRRPEFSHPHR
jgi:CheY-like chemotaxis protein